MSKRLIAVLLSVSVLVVLVGCGGGGGGGGGGSTATGNISGYAYAPVGKGSRVAQAAPTSYEPLVGGTVTAGGISTTTNSDGYYVLTGVPTGQQTLTITKTDVGSLTKTVEVLAGQTIVGTAEGSTESVLSNLTPAEWTILVYQAADNNLEFAALSDLERIKSVGSSIDVNIVVQQDLCGGGCTQTSAYGYETLGTINTSTRRLFIKQNEAVTIENLGELDMTDPTVLQNFITWGVQNYPANHYALILWNHGGGWESTNYTSLARSADSFGTDHNNNSQSTTGDMNLDEIKSALSNAGTHFDIIGFAACLMGQVETAYELKGQADILIASEEVILVGAFGWDYNSFLGALTTTPTMTAQQLAQNIVSTFKTDAENGFRAQQESLGYTTNPATHIAAIDLTKMDALKTAIDSFADTLVNNGASQYASYLANTQSYSKKHYRDLYDFASNTGVTEANALMTAIDDAVIKTEYIGTETANSHGLSIYLPSEQERYEQFYSQYSYTDFGSSSTWKTFLDQLATGSPTQLVNDYFCATVYWDTDADIDLYIFEPDPVNSGQWLLYAPWLYSTTWFGYFSSDSAISGVSVESYCTDYYVYPGYYYVYADYYQDGITSSSANVYLESWNKNGDTYTDQTTMTQYTPIDPTYGEGVWAAMWALMGSGTSRIAGRAADINPPLPDGVKEKIMELREKKRAGK